METPSTHEKGTSPHKVGGTNMFREILRVQVVVILGGLPNLKCFELPSLEGRCWQVMFLFGAKTSAGQGG